MRQDTWGALPPTCAILRLFMGPSFSTTSTWTRLRELFLKHRRRIATLVLFLGLAIIAVKVSSGVPRDTRVSVRIGPDHAEITEARIDYRSDGQLVHSVTRHWAQGAPAEVRHDLELLPGDYSVTVRLSARDGTMRFLDGQLSAPADGVVQLALEPR
jgi:hypothetical protein